MRRTARDLAHPLALALALAVSAALPLAPARAAGEVRVNVKPAEELTDVGRGADRARNVKALAAHFQALAGRLPADQVLSVDVLDVKLAGELRPARHGEELRVLKGGADWPRIELDWRLARGGEAIASGHDRLADMNYLSTPLRAGQDGALPYEARLIERWFTERVAPAAAAATR